MSNQGSEQREQFSISYEFARGRKNKTIKLVKCDNVPFSGRTNSQDCLLMHYLKGYRLTVNDQNTGFYVHHNPILENGMIRNGDKGWCITGENGRNLNVHAIESNVNTLGDALMACYASHYAFNKHGIPVTCDGFNGIARTQLTKYEIVENFLAIGGSIPQWEMK